MPLPHITNSKAGINMYEPDVNTYFEVYFITPPALRDRFQKDEMLLTEHVKEVSGLGSLDPTLEKLQQEFMGTHRTYIMANPPETSHEISVTFTLNLRDDVDNYIYKYFKAWNKLGYDLETGKRHLKRDYAAPWLKILKANRVGDVYREIVYQDVMCTIEDSGQDTLNYTGNDAAELKVKFFSDWAKDIDA